MLDLQHIRYFLPSLPGSFRNETRSRIFLPVPSMELSPCSSTVLSTVPRRSAHVCGAGGSVVRTVGDRRNGGRSVVGPCPICNEMPGGAYAV